jgi:hypothetical protein
MMIFLCLSSFWIIHTSLFFLVAQAQYQMHVAEMESLRAGMPPVFVNHNSGGGPAIRDVHMENFNVTVGGRDLIQEATITLAFGRHYGELQLSELCCVW